VPTYQYQCTECGEGLEAVQKFTDDALTVCPSCDGRLKKVFSAVGIVFKGSGFYRNDSRGSSSSSSPAAGRSRRPDRPTRSRRRVVGLEVVVGSRLQVVLEVSKSGSKSSSTSSSSGSSSPRNALGIPRTL
jgi:putative FmdB family regulatory protein